MQTLRNAHLFARFVLVWFVLSIGVAVASPLVKPQNGQLVCSASGSVKLVADGGDADIGSVLNTMDCPLCVAVGAPPPMALAPVAGVMGLGYALPQLAEAPTIQVARAALPPRGPPPAL
jgi:hypothetical protein